MLNNKLKISNLSTYLFWDVDRSKIDFIKNKRWLINRVIEYGKVSDWLIIVKMYGIKEIAEMAITMRDVDIKTASFISALSNVPKEKFICYNIKQLASQHWNF